MGTRLRAVQARVISELTSVSKLDGFTTVIGVWAVKLCWRKKLVHRRKYRYLFPNWIINRSI